MLSSCCCARAAVQSLGVRTTFETQPKCHVSPDAPLTLLCDELSLKLHFYRQSQVCGLCLYRFKCYQSPSAAAQIKTAPHLSQIDPIKSKRPVTQKVLTFNQCVSENKH